MNTAALKKFAQAARRQLNEQVAARLELVLQSDSAELRQQEKGITQLNKEIENFSKAAVIERVAYTWFNRFCALRYMDVNRYTSIGVVSPAEDFSQPEILQEAKQGYIDEELQVESKRVFDLLGGRIPASNPQQEAYRLLLVVECNRMSRIMPFMFQQISDYTELLMPDDLLSEQSILVAVRETLSADSCQDVEVIGWLYQFYISEKKNQVFDGLKKNKKITPENIPAATQLFTPHWIVRYLVENSLGRLWMLNKPASNLVAHMDYYIKPEEVETDFLKVGSPEELKICDPACGSGHMLTYAFDLLYQIYEEEGYNAKDIPQLILTKNLYGIEIDERAGELAAFALTMKAREKYRRFFRKTVQPNICVLENVSFAEGELKPYIEAVGRDLFTMNLQTLLHQFEEADNFGSLIRPAVEDVAHVRQVIKEKRVGEQLTLAHVHPRVMRVLEQAEYLSSRYHVVVANPPYMGGRGMNGRLAGWAKEKYPKSKSDLFAMFIERSLELVKRGGSVAMITMQSWMFLSSFEAFRTNIIKEGSILSMAHLGTRAFDTIGGEIVSTTAFVISNLHKKNFLGGYLDLTNGKSENEKEFDLKRKRNHPTLAIGDDFERIPGCQIAYWLNEKLLSIFSLKRMSDFLESGGRCKTHNDEKYVRYIWEISFSSLTKKWKVYNKGGESRKWYGNLIFVFDWSSKAKSSYGNFGGLSNPKFWDRPGITWSGISGDKSTFRLKISDSEYASVSPTIIIDDDNLRSQYMAFLNSVLADKLLKVINPTVMVNVGDALKLPSLCQASTYSNVMDLIDFSRKDWNSYETSWEFTGLPLLNPDYRQSTVMATHHQLLAHWWEMTLEMKRLEEENNYIFINAYGLQDELTTEVPLSEITLTCNPYHRYGGDKNEEELECLLRADTMREFLSYAVGCMFGRYSLDKPGLILANQSETLADYLEHIQEPTFMPDHDNVIPILDSDWFMDDIVARFRTFLKVTFGEEHYEENLQFIEEAIGKDIRKFFLKDFYTDHIKRYKKRPIYWLFSSPKGSFNALIYMHRYSPDTVSIILNDYLREFRTKLTSRREHLEQVSISVSASNAEKSRALKEIEKLKKTIDELRDYEDTILYPLATEQIEIDLDDGVKANYPKFGKALKKVAGLS